MKKIRTHYDNLKVSHDAPPEVIRMAYKALIAKYHPDRNPNNEESVRIVQAINDSYEVLMDEEKRRKHDQWIAEQERPDLEVARTVARNWPQTEEDLPPRKPERPPRSGCGCLGLASFLCTVLFIVFAVATTLTSSSAPSGNRNVAQGTMPAVPIKPAHAAPAPRPQMIPPEAVGARVVNVYWDGKQHPVRADRAVAIRKKVDVASWYVSEYLKKKEEKAALEKRLKGSVFGKEQLRRKIAEIDAQMNELDASGMDVIREVEDEIKASAP